MLKVLFLCTENACRSQMAEGLVNHDLAGQVKAFSAGVRPSRVNPRAIKVMAELGIDISQHRSKSVDDLAGEQLRPGNYGLRPGPATVSHLSRGNRGHARGLPGPSQGHRFRSGDHGRLPAGAGRLAGATGAAAPGEIPKEKLLSTTSNMPLHCAERPLESAADQKVVGTGLAACVCQHEPEGHQVSEAHPATPRIRRLSQVPVIGSIFRFSGWWLVFLGIYASSSVCVF